ncbi:hypothetical protein QZH41_011179 [Actinostola sp. cb2023]|nr:hypothetical protein QZH41_011179 [Actinostola sp. cb2023]
MATACDFKLMSKDAEIRYVQARMNVSPGWGGGARLVKLVGRQKALEILLQSKKINLVEALKCGLVDDELRISDKKDVLEVAADWLAPYLESEAPVIKALKGVVAAGDDLSMDDALRIER